MTMIEALVGDLEMYLSLERHSHNDFARGTEAEEILKINMEQTTDTLAALKKELGIVD